MAYVPPPSEVGHLLLYLEPIVLLRPPLEVVPDSVEVELSRRFDFFYCCTAAIGSGTFSTRLSCWTMSSRALRIGSPSCRIRVIEFGGCVRIVNMYFAACVR